MGKHLYTWQAEKGSYRNENSYQKKRKEDKIKQSIRIKLDFLERNHNDDEEFSNLTSSLIEEDDKYYQLNDDNELIKLNLQALDKLDKDLAQIIAKSGTKKGT